MGETTVPALRAKLNIGDVMIFSLVRNVKIVAGSVFRTRFQKDAVIYVRLEQDMTSQTAGVLQLQ